MTSLKKRLKRLHILIVFAMLLTPIRSIAGDDTLSHTLFVGEFRQGGMVKWTGKMLLYLRYDSEASGISPVSGVITWPTLGEAQTKIEGTINGKEVNFRETECIKTSCSKILLGGNYRATFNSSLTELSGTSSHGSFGLTGSFTLRQAASK